MAIPSSSSSPEQQTSKHSRATIMQPQKTNGVAAPQSISPTSQQDLAIFYHKILCCPTKRTLLQSIKYGSFSTWLGLTEKLISKYLPESEITAKGHLDQQKQRPEAEAVETVTPLSTKAVENTSEVLHQLFDPTEKNILT